MFKSGAFVIWMTLSILWIGATTPFVVLGWESVVSAADRHHSGRVSFCRARYGDAAARRRCIEVMDLERFQDLAKAVFNRFLLIAGPPLAGIATLMWVRHKHAPSRRPNSRAGR